MRLISRWHVREQFVRIPEGRNVEVGPRSFWFQATGREGCYVHGVRVPRRVYFALLRWIISRRERRLTA